MGVTGMNAPGVKPQSGKTLSNEEWAATVTDAEVALSKMRAYSERLANGLMVLAGQKVSLRVYVDRLLQRAIEDAESVTRESIAESRRNK